MAKRQVKLESENIDRLGKTGMTKYTLDDALHDLLNFYDDSTRYLIYDEEPQTERLKAIIKKAKR